MNTSVSERPDTFGRNNFDLIRIAAATQVLVFHALRRLELTSPPWLNVGLLFPGVPIFFVVSGYLVSASYERGGDSWGYFRNRILRIYPALWVCVTATVVVVATFGFDVFEWTALGWIVAQFLGAIYTPAFLAGFGFGSYNGSLWTIPVELQFYCLLPLPYLLCKRRQALDIAWYVLFSLSLAFALVIGWRMPNLGTALESASEKLVRYSILPHFFLFASGVLLQRFRVNRLRVVAGKGLYWLAGYVVLCRTLPTSPISLIATRLGLAICTISLAYTLPGAADKLMRRNDISYGVYIYHGLILGLLVTLHRVGAVEYFFVVLFGAYAAGYLSWRFVEKPFLRRKEHEQRALAPQGD